MSAAYGLFDKLIPANRVCALGHGQPNELLHAKLSALTVQSALAGQRIVDQDAARCCLAGLWLLHDFLDESHAISQEIETAEGSYWHAIMHRREPDYGNSKYWFRRVGSHLIFPALQARAKDLIAAEDATDSIARELQQAKEWDPYRFVDWCEQLARGKASQTSLAQHIAQAEWELLFAACYEQAIEGSL